MLVSASRFVLFDNIVALGFRLLVLAILNAGLELENY